MEPFGAQIGAARALLNLRAAKTMSLSKGSKLRASVEILNALNAANPWDISFVSGPTFLQPQTIDSPRIA